MKKVRFLAWPALALATLGALAPAAVAQENCAQGLSIEPAREEIDLKWRHGYTVTIRNCTDRAIDVVAEAATLGQDLDGQPSFVSDGGPPGFTAVGTGSFRLGPGRSRALQVEAQIPVRQERSLYAGIIAEFEPGGSGTSVAVRNRVASMLLMRGPKPWDESVAIADHGLIPLEDGTYEAYAIVSNQGDVHITPTARFSLLRGGEEVTRVDLNGGIILPDAARRFSGVWDGDVPPGRYKAVATITGPFANRSALIDLPGGEAPAPAARITSLIASDLDGPYVEAEITNRGATPFAPALQIVVTEGEIERARTNLPVRRIPARRARTATWRPDLGDGTYRVTARVVDGSRVLDERSTEMRIGDAPPSAAGSEETGSRLPILVLAAALLALLAALLLWAWRRRDRDEHGPNPPGSARAGRLDRARDPVG